MPRPFAALAAGVFLACALPAHAGEAVEVTMQQFAFAPASIQVSAGATITWINRDSVPHTVTSVDGGFDSGPVAPGQSFAWTASKPVSYRCTFHPSMTGSIDIKPAK